MTNVCENSQLGQTVKQELLLSLLLFTHSLRQNSQQHIGVFFFFFHKSTELSAETEGNSQGKRREKKKEGGGRGGAGDGGVVWPTFHVSVHSRPGCACGAAGELM